MHRGDGVCRWGFGMGEEAKEALVAEEIQGNGTKGSPRGGWNLIQ